MSPKKTASGTAPAMKQSKLDFNAGKRTASTTGTGKPQAKGGAGGSIASFFTPAAATAAPVPITAEVEATKTSITKLPDSNAGPKHKGKATDHDAHAEADDRDDIEPADDFDEDAEYIGSDTESESVSSVTTFETVEEKPADADAPVVQGRTTRSQAAAAAAAASPLKNGGKAMAKDAVTATPVPTPKKRKIGKEEAEDEIESAGDMDVDTVDAAAAAAGVTAVAVGKDAGMFKPSNRTEEEAAKRVEANDRQASDKTTANGSAASKAVKRPDATEEKQKEREKEPTELRVKAIKWRKYLDKLKEKYGDVSDIHGEDENRIHQILRYFDNEYAYGPCVGVTRRERWDRAQALGLNPPKEIDEILSTIEGKTMDEYVQSVFYGQV